MTDFAFDAPRPISGGRHLAVIKTLAGPFDIGLLTVHDNSSFTYRPEVGFGGNDAFRYVASENDPFRYVASEVGGTGKPAPVARAVTDTGPGTAE